MCAYMYLPVPKGQYFATKEIIGKEFIYKIYYSIHSNMKMDVKTKLWHFVR